MKLDCSSLQEMAHSLSLVKECDVVRSGALRLCTPFVYPNGTNIDVFFEPKKSLFESYILSDFGQTSLYLDDALVRMASTDRRKKILEDICSEYRVVVRDSMFQVEILSEEITDISDAILRLSQACLRVSDFASHQRLRSANGFRDDVEDFLEASGLLFAPDIKVPGQSGKDVRLDFQVNRSYVLVLAAMNESAAHASANEILSKWFDLPDEREDRTKVTIYNSQSKAIKEADIKKLARLSEPIAYPEQAELLIQVLSHAA